MGRLGLSGSVDFGCAVTTGEDRARVTRYEDGQGHCNCTCVDLRRNRLQRVDDCGASGV